MEPKDTNKELTTENAFEAGYAAYGEAAEKKLFIVETISMFKQTYVVEAKELEHAYDEVTMVNSGAEGDFFESVEGEWLGETIIGGRKISMKKYNKLLEEIEKKGTGSHWMGEQLIRKIDYSK